ncbi:hypothetical protein ABZY81_32715 [Streptomyces sp. NPDC006514]|uniref:hypothetical protein n=1 Tax=Streptomyces sp. NPDC006514 TaxID=3154308 RepID=UPI0033B80A6B
MAVDALPGIHCTFLGDVRFELFDRDDGRLAAVVLHYGATLRWGQWDGDPVRADGHLLLERFDAYEMPFPLQQFEADRRHAEEGAAEQRDWLAAMPDGPEGTVVVVGIPGRRPRARAGPASHGGLTTKIRLAAIFIWSAR